MSDATDKPRLSKDRRTAYVDIVVRWPPAAATRAQAIAPSAFDEAQAKVAQVLAMTPEVVEGLKAQVLDLHRAAE